MIFFRHFSSKFALVAILCATAIFFFPVARGSYSAVHGPVTALRSIRTKFWNWLALALVALRVVRCHLSGCISALRISPHEGVISRPSHPENAAVLRC